MIEMDEITKENLVIAGITGLAAFAVAFFALQYKPTFEQKIRKMIR